MHYGSVSSAGHARTEDFLQMEYPSDSECERRKRNEGYGVLHCTLCPSCAFFGARLLFPGKFCPKGHHAWKYSLPIDDDIVFFDAGLSINAVPGKAKAIIRTDIPLPELPEGITAVPAEGCVCLEACGVSSHAANPAVGKRAICMMTGFLRKLPLKPDSHKAMELMYTISSDFYGNTLGIAGYDKHTYI